MPFFAASEARIDEIPCKLPASREFGIFRDEFAADSPLQQTVCLSRSRFRRSRTRLSARVWAAGLAIGSAETLRFFDIEPIGGNISVGPNSSTAVRLMWWRDCHAGPNEVGPSLTYGRSLNPDWAQAKPSTIR